MFVRIVPYARRHSRRLLIILLLLAPLALSGAVQPILVGQAVSLLKDEPTAYAFLRDRPLTQGINILSFCLLVTILVRLVLQALTGYLVQNVGQRITADIRVDLFKHVTSLASSFFDRTPVGQLITRLTSDVEALGDVFSTGAIGVISDVFSILVIVVVMFTIQWHLALMLLCILLPIAGLIIYFQHQYRKANYKAREQLSELNSNLQENIVGIGIVQLFRRERYNSELFRRVNHRYIKAVDRTILYDAAVSATLEWTSLIAIAGVLWVWRWHGPANKLLTLGCSLHLSIFAQKLFFPLQQLAEKFTAIQAGLTAVERINDLMEQPVEIRDQSTLKHWLGLKERPLRVK